jgi:hypothetical protein
MLHAWIMVVDIQSFKKSIQFKVYRPTELKYKKCLHARTCNYTILWHTTIITCISKTSLTQFILNKSENVSRNIYLKLIHLASLFSKQCYLNCHSYGYKHRNERDFALSEYDILLWRSLNTYNKASFTLLERKKLKLWQQLQCLERLLRISLTL